MKAVYIRLLCAILLLATLTVATTARAAKPAPVYADTVAGTCAFESSATSESGVRVQHIHLECVDLHV